MNTTRHAKPPIKFSLCCFAALLYLAGCGQKSEQPAEPPVQPVSRVVASPTPPAASLSPVPLTPPPVSEAQATATPRATETSSTSTSANGEMPRLVEEGIQLIEAADSWAATEKLCNQFRDVRDVLQEQAEERLKRGEENSGMATMKSADLNGQLMAAARFRQEGISGIKTPEKAKVMRDECYEKARQYAREAEEYLKR